MKKKTKVYVFLTLSVMILISSVSPAAGCRPRRGIYVIEDDPDDGKNITDHIWSSDGRKIAYLMCPDDRSLLYTACELWVADWKWGKLRNKQLIYTGVEWSSLEDWQGDWILFLMRHEVKPSDYNSTHATRELWKIRDDGTDLTQVTFTNTNGIRTTWSNPAYTNMGTASGGRFIPGTDLLAFSAHNGNGWYKLYTCINDGSNPMWYNSISTPYDSFTWGMSPTGNKLLFGDARGGWNAPTNLYASNVDGTGKTLLKIMPHRTPHLVLADGDTIVYRYVPLPAVPPSLEGNIYAINMDGSIEWTIIDDEYLNYPENYNPLDGQALLMRSNRSKDGNMHIFTLNVDGTGIVRLTRGPYNDEAAFYSPNGRYIMYRRLPEDYVKDGSKLPYPYDLVIVRVWYWHRHFWPHWHRHYSTTHCSKMGKRF